MARRLEHGLDHFRKASVPADRLREELPAALAELARLESMVSSLKLHVLAEADRRKLAEDEAATGTPAWAAKLTGSTQAVMSGGLWLAERLRDKYHATREAFADGGIDEHQAKVIVKAAETIPPGVTEDERADAEALLVAKAVGGMNAGRLRRAARRMLETINRRLADQHESDQLEKENESAAAKTEMSLWDNGDGTFTGKFTIPELHGQLLKAALERLTSPRRLSRNKAGDLVNDPTVTGGCEGLNVYERRGVAFTELLEHLPTQGFRTEILDLGRTKRLHTEAQRRALSLVYDTCAAEGCERPFAWSDIHHPEPWSEGGGTDLVNGLPLCGHHHRRAHDRNYRHELLPSGELRFRRRR